MTWQVTLFFLLFILAICQSTRRMADRWWNRNAAINIAFNKEELLVIFTRKIEIGSREDNRNDVQRTLKQLSVLVY